MVLDFREPLLEERKVLYGRESTKPCQSKPRNAKSLAFQPSKDLLLQTSSEAGHLPIS